MNNAGASNETNNDIDPDVESILSISHQVHSNAPRGPSNDDKLNIPALDPPPSCRTPSTSNFPNISNNIPEISNTRTESPKQDDEPHSMHSTQLTASKQSPVKKIEASQASQAEHEEHEEVDQSDSDSDCCEGSGLLSSHDKSISSPTNSAYGDVSEWPDIEDSKGPCDTFSACHYICVICVVTVFAGLITALLTLFITQNDFNKTLRYLHDTLQTPWNLPSKSSSSPVESLSVSDDSSDEAEEQEDVFDPGFKFEDIFPAQPKHAKLHAGLVSASNTDWEGAGMGAEGSCAALGVHSVVLTPHHKSGWILSTHLARIINLYCDREVAFVLDVINMLQFVREIGDMLARDKSRIVAWIHLNRQPLNVIISGYNYHSYTLTEPFVLKPLEFWVWDYFNRTVPFHHDRLMQMLQETKRPGNGQRWSEDARLPFSQVLSMLTRADILNENLHFMATAGGVEVCLIRNTSPLDGNVKFDEFERTMLTFFDTNQTLQNVYGSVGMKDGLLTELVRFYNCEWFEYAMMYVLEKYTYEFGLIHTVWMEHYTNGSKEFDEMLVGVLKKAGFKPKRKDKVLTEKLQREDLNREHNRKEFSTALAEHVSSLQNIDTEEQIQTLLNYHFPLLCHWIKNMTVSLNVHWKYQDIC